MAFPSHPKKSPPAARAIAGRSGRCILYRLHVVVLLGFSLRDCSRLLFALQHALPHYRELATATIVEHIVMMNDTRRDRTSPKSQERIETPQNDQAWHQSEPAECEGLGPRRGFVLGRRTDVFLLYPDASLKMGLGCSSTSWLFGPRRAFVGPGSWLPLQRSRFNGACFLVTFSTSSSWAPRCLYLFPRRV